VPRFPRGNGSGRAEKAGQAAEKRTTTTTTIDLDAFSSGFFSLIFFSFRMVLTSFLSRNFLQHAFLLGLFVLRVHRHIGSILTSSTYFDSNLEYIATFTLCIHIPTATIDVWLSYVRAHTRPARRMKREKGAGWQKERQGEFVCGLIYNSTLYLVL
jgi:hypothetical protein